MQNDDLELDPIALPEDLADFISMDAESTDSTMEDELEKAIEDQMLFSMLFENEGQAFFTDESMGESVNDLSFFNEEKSTKESSGTPKFDVTDFECEPAFNILKEKIALVSGKKTSKDKRAEAGAWLFGEEDNQKDITFSLCCGALSARPNLLRVRTQYEFYRNGIVFDAPLPDTAVLPDYFCLEISGLYGADGLDIAEYIWAMPGLRADRLAYLMNHMEEDDMHEVIKGMERRGLISIQGGFWYFTGRNPLLMKQNACFHWSKLVGL